MKIDKEEEIMFNIEEYLLDKEYEFVDNYKGMPFGEVLDEIESETGYVNDFSDFQQLMEEKFLKEMLNDSEFLDLNVVGHFHREDGTQIFGICLIGKHEPCECCGDVVSEWIAIMVNPIQRKIGYGVQKCHDYESVKDSSYQGETIHEIKALIDRYYNYREC